MTWNFGSGAISAAYLGSTEVAAAYLGSNLLWRKSGNTPVPGSPIALYHYEEDHVGSVDDIGNYEGGLFNLWRTGYAAAPPARFGSGVGRLIDVMAAGGGSSSPGATLEGATGRGSMSQDICMVRNNGSMIIPSLDFTAFTFECWLRPVIFVAPNNMGLGAEGSATVNLVFVNRNDGTMPYRGTSFGASEGAEGGGLNFWLSANADFTGQCWHHVAYVFDGISTLSLYMDGTLFGQETDPHLAGMLAEGTFYQIGLRCHASVQGAVYSEFDLAIDEFALFDYARYTGNFTPPTEPYSLTSI